MDWTLIGVIVVPTSQRKSNFSDIRDIFSYILLFAPNFPNRNVTLEGEFEQLDAAIGELTRRVSSPEVLELLEQCRAESRASLQLFKESREVEARKQIRAANETFSKAGKLRKSKASAERVEEDYQEDQDQPRPSTTTH